MADKPKEPATAPQAEQWYPIVLGSSFKDHSKHFYSLRYEFKPASIDTSKPGAMHKGAENKVTVELSNNQPGKPKVVFQGISEDCKDLDAILFFDGKTLRLEKMHRAVKTLRHLRPGETSSSLAAANPTGDNNNRSPFHLNGEDTNAYRVPREHVEEIVIGSQPESASRKNDKKAVDNNNGKKVLKASPAKSSPAERKKSPAQYSPPEKKRTSPPMDEQLDSKRFKAQDNYFYQNNNNDNVEHIDVNIDDEPAAAAEHESDYELEDIDVSDEEEGQVKETAEPSSAGNELSNNTKPANSSESQSSSSSSSGSDGGSSDGSDDESASLGEI